MWAGVVIKLSDGTTHAIEFSGSFITADVKDVKLDSWKSYASVWIQGSGRYWTEGADMGPKTKQRELLAGRSEIEK